ncbi:MAG: phospholipid carrier-dependent glycosyltransferase, partial [Anaerolineae bacterium]|nr:phospholipid carrier-dependent glycosyltransferase [Anaerolineae bacterium]
MRVRKWLAGVLDRRESLLLAIILLTALTLRLYNVNWDEGHHAHPDERWICMVATEMHWPKDLATAFDPHATTWNPLYDYNGSKAAGEYRMRHFAYGHLPLYLLTVIAWALHDLAPLAEKLGMPGGLVHWLFMANTYDGFPQVGRPLSALFDTGTVLLMYLIGRRVYDRRVGLLAAAFSALTVLQIQLAHFYAFDPVATFFIMVALLGSVRMAQEGDVRSAVLAGVGAGCAVSSKFSAMPILAALGIGALIPAWRAFRLHGWNSPQAAVQLSRGVKLALVAILVAVVAFAVTSPFALLDWKAYRTSVIEEQGAMVRGKVDFPYTRQYRGTTPYIYQIKQQVRWGMGWPLGLVAFLGFGWVLARAMRGRARLEEWVLLAWAVPYFGITGAFMVKFMRYMLPVVPLFALMGAAMLWAWWDAGRRGGESASQRVSESANQRGGEEANQRVSEEVGQRIGEEADQQDVAPRPPLHTPRSALPASRPP